MDQIDFTPEELQEAPLLESLRKSPLQAAPDGYFDTFAARLQARIEEEDLLDQAPMLRSAGKKTPFVVPAGYFEALPDRVMRALGRDGGHIRPMFVSLYATAAAAVIILLLMWKGTSPAADQAFPSMPELSAEEFLAIVDIDEDMIVEAFGPEDLALLMVDLPIPSYIPESATNKLADDLSFDEMIDQLDQLDDADLDALEAELIQEEEGDWF